MTKVTLNSKDVMWALVSLSKRLADAILWVYPRKGKIRLEVPMTMESPLIIEDFDCWKHSFSPERVEAEILLAVLREMGKKSPRKSTPKPKRRK